MKSIYKTEEGKKQILALYDEQLGRINSRYNDVWIDTSLGKTHIVETGNLNGEPLLVFHGGNATSAYNLLFFSFMFADYHIYAADIIGHPGKSAETCLPARGYDYGKWAGEVIDGLGYSRISCCAGSFGAGVLAKTMCVAPEKIKKAVLYVPSGIKNAPAVNSVSMMFPMIMYWLTRKDEWLRKTMLPMAVTESNITEDIYQTAKLSINYAKVKTAMPSNVSARLIKKCRAPVLVMAAEKDCLFPGKGVINRALKIIPNCTAYLIKGRGHMHIMTGEEKEMIRTFLK